jgi:hypothetical protein
MKKWWVLGIVFLVILAGCVYDEEYEELEEEEFWEYNEEPTCGDIICEEGENECSCPFDCGECDYETDAACMTYACNLEEECVLTQASDCCGNEVCESGESPFNCEVDCPKTVYEEMGNTCNNFVCDAYESSENCCVDCGCPETYSCVNNKCVKCGDGVCEEKVESKQSCCRDCGCSGSYECIGNNCREIDPSKYRLETKTPRELREAAALDALPHTFSFSYGEEVYSIELNMSDTLFLYYKSRERGRDYDLYASDPYDDEFITQLANKFNEIGENITDSPFAPAGLAVSFVQSLPYTSDNVTTPFDEYPRFTYETLHENGGDCEDTSILTAAILQEMGYGVMLVSVPGHMAVAALCDGSLGFHYELDGEDYCYLETTGEGWDLGEIPEEYSSVEAELLSVEKRPYILIKSSSWEASCDFEDCSVREEVVLQNLGSEIPVNGKVVIIAEAPGDRMWDISEIDLPPLKPEETYTIRKTLKVPYMSQFRVSVWAEGDNFVSDELATGWAEWS